MNIFGHKKEEQKAEETQVEQAPRVGLSPVALSVVKSQLEQVQEMASYNKCNSDLSPRLRDAYAAKEDAYEVALSIIAAAEKSQRTVTLTAAGIQVSEANMIPRGEEEEQEEG